MKILVFSDSHGVIEPMLEIVRRERPDEIFHLGDGAWDVDNIHRLFQSLPIIQVSGNCDLVDPCDIPLEQIVEREGVRILLTHGHTYSVKQGTDRLLAAARGQLMDVALFGHTHLRCCEQREGIWLMNPGCIGNLYDYTYGIILIQNGTVRCYTDQKQTSG